MQYELVLPFLVRPNLNNQSKNLTFYSSPDGLTWNSENNNFPILSGRAGKWDEHLYKSSFVWINDTFKVWYSAFSATGSSKVGYTQLPYFDDTETNRFLTLARYFYVSHEVSVPFSIGIKKYLSKSLFSEESKGVI